MDRTTAHCRHDKGDSVTDIRNLTHLPVVGSRRSPTVDFSSLSNLASCQWRWYARYVLGMEDRPGSVALLGTLLGELCSTWWEGNAWEPLLKVRLEEWRAENPEAGFQPAWMEKAHWLMERYVAHYGPERDSGSVKVLASELFFKLRLPNRYGYLVGAIDQLWEIDGHVYVVERKSMADWSRIERHSISHQTTFYYWAAQQLGYEPWGIILDCIRTYQWKRDYHPPTDSFERRWLDRGDEHLRNAIIEAGKGLTLAKALVNGSLEPLRNFDDACSWCAYRNECLADLGFSDLAVPEEFAWEI